MPETLPDIATLARFVEFGKSLVGDRWGWQKMFALRIGLKPGQVTNILKHRAPIGPAIREKLARHGCDIEWLMTGEHRETDSPGRVCEPVSQLGGEAELLKKRIAELESELADRDARLEKAARILGLEALSVNDEAVKHKKRGYGRKGHE